MLGPHLLGRVEAPDDRHVQLHPLRAAAPVSVEATIRQPTLDAYDQGNTPRCVAYSASRVVNFFNQYAFDADWLYAECKKIDPWPGQDGTSARYACDVLRAEGHWRKIRGTPVKAGPKPAHGITANTWATSVDDIRAVLARAKPQPVLLGIDWYEAWFQPTMSALAGHDYWLQPMSAAGRVAGGHEIGVWAASDKRQAFGLRNTWGNSWPSLVWVSYADVERMLASGADACVMVDASTR